MNHFGGSWTETKLKALGKYLAAYRTIFCKNPRAQFFKTISIYGFAVGNGRAVGPALRIAVNIIGKA